MLCYRSRMDEPHYGDPPHHRLYVSILGGSRCSARQYQLAQETGRLLAELGAVVVCGGLGGVMEAAARGAHDGGGVCLGVLPGYDRAPANPYVDYVITTGMGHGRNVIVAANGDAVIAIGGEYGTLSEIGLAGKIGRPVIVLDGWRLTRDEGAPGLWYASTPEEAIALLHQALGLTPSLPE